MALTLTERIHGALTGAVIGAELSFGQWQRPRDPAAPADLFARELAPTFTWKPEPDNQWEAKVTPLIGLGARAYIAAGGRATPEGFAALLRDDPEVMVPAFTFDGLHTVQELLHEGMHPRLSGLHNAPSGLVAACMPAVGLFHFADPERAYLDGVELASVAQPRRGADWAGLCAAAVAAACIPGATPAGIAAEVLAVALRHDRDQYCELKSAVRAMSTGGLENFTTKWGSGPGFGVVPQTPAFTWMAPDPIRFALPALSLLADDPVKLMQAIIGVTSHEWCISVMLGNHAVPAVICGAVAGALGGSAAFPTAWRAWAEPLAEPGFALAGVVEKRRAQERVIISAVEVLAAPQASAQSQLTDRLRGALLASSIGNAMGSPVECRSWQYIAEKYPGGVTTILEPQRLESEDDNQMMQLLAETYIERDGLPVMARQFGLTWANRLNRDHFFPLCMGNAYDQIRAGGDPRITGHWSVVTGSTVMAMEPVGMFNLGDPEWAAQDATAVSYMYQRGLDVVAAACLSAATAAALLPGASVDSVVAAALAAAPRTPFKTFDLRKFASAHAYLCACLEVASHHQDVWSARAELSEKCLLYHLIDPLEVLGLALAMLTIAKGDVRQAAIGGTNIGRDSDTIAGRAAMLAGALSGTAGIPPEWIALFSKAGLARIDRNGERLAAVVGERRQETLRRRAAV